VADRFTIQRVPTGLLDVLGMKTSGDNPSSLAPFVQAGLDLREFYDTQTITWRVFNQGGANGAVGVRTFNTGTTPPIVPDGELWVVRNFGMSSVNLAVGESYTIRLGWARNVFGSNRPLNWWQYPPQTFTGTAAGVGVNIGWQLPYPLIWMPGDGMIWENVVFAGVATTNLGGSIEYSKYEI